MCLEVSDFECASLCKDTSAVVVGVVFESVERSIRVLLYMLTVGNLLLSE